MVGGAWTVPASQYGRHTKVGMAYDYTNDIMEYHRTALGRGWDNSANAVYTTVVDAGSNDCGDQYYGRSSADGTNVYLRGDIYTATYPDIIIAHEWGHNIS